MKAISNPIPVQASHTSIPAASSILRPYLSMVDAMAKVLQQVGAAIFTMVAEGSIVVPVALLVIMNYDFGYALWFITPVISGAVALLIVNLNLAPVKTILHFFFANVAFMLLVVLIHLLHG